MILSPVDAVLNLAWWLRWVTETQGPNRGEAVDAIIRVTGLNPQSPPPGLISIPWCACFVAACGYAVLRDLWPLKKVAGCVSLFDDANAKKLIRLGPDRGRIFLLHNGTRFNHTGFCKAPGVVSGTWTTIEGNTNAGGSPEGTGVFERTRAFPLSARFIEWNPAP
jgi:hypothetical protein